SLLPPRPPLFPYTTLFRSWGRVVSAITPSARRSFCGHGSVTIDRPSAFAVDSRFTAIPHVLHDRRYRRQHASRAIATSARRDDRSEEHTSELQSLAYLVCR